MNEKRRMEKIVQMAGVWMSCLAFTGLALEKEVSLVTKQPLGELAVAGRLSIDLHAEFMVSRSYGSETVLNWYNCGYSGGGGKDGKVTQVGGTFGDFGFQVPYKEREEKYPHAVTVGNVRAVRFDGNDFLKGNFEVEPALAGAQNMTLEIWFRSAKPEKSEILLGWQSRDGKESSAAIGYPESIKGSDAWRHLLITCTPASESWYLDGIKVSSGKRTTLIKEGHILVLGGASESKPSFKGDLVAVRLHDACMTDEEIAHNVKGGVMLGTALQTWWRTEPDKWTIKESEHFRYGEAKEKTAAREKDARALKEFNERVPNMFNMAEVIYRTYSERLAMRSSVVSVKPEERGDGIKYKIPIQESDGSWMGWDGHFGWACQGAGHINPHELAHGWQGMTGSMAGNFWEVMANFPQTYNGIYQTMPPSTRESSVFFPAMGWNYYHYRMFFEHLAQTPEYGPMFISKLWYDGPMDSDKNRSPYPFSTFTRLNPIPERTLDAEYTKMAMRNVTWDYTTFKECRPGEKGNTPYGNDGVVSEENLYAREWRQLQNNRTLMRDAQTLLEKIPYEPEWWRVPKAMAPQQLGYNVCPLSFKAGTITATLAGYVNPARGSDWRAAFVGVDAQGKPVYGTVFGPGKAQSFDATADLKELYLVVCAIPTNIMEINMVGDFRSFEQEPFPYKVKLNGCEPLDILKPEKPTAEGAPHRNGGGFVAKTAQVEASAYVAPGAQVLGNSKVLGNARIEDLSIVQDSTVQDNAVLSGRAMVMQNSIVSGRAKIRDYGEVRNHSTVTDDARVLEHASIHSGKTCGDQVTAKGFAHAYGGSQRGTAMLDGSYAKANEITKGKWFTWSWGGGKNPGEVDEDFCGLYADYDFEAEHPWMACDAFGATWGYLVNKPVYQSVTLALAGSNKTDRALVLNGKDQFVELQKDLADFNNVTYTVTFKWDDNKEGSRLFEFANENGDALWLTPSENGRMVFAIRKGKVLEQVATAKPLRTGMWVTAQVVLEGAHATLLLNGMKAAEQPKMTLRPESIQATQCFLGRGLKGNYFGGTIGRFTVHSIALVDHAAPTPNPATFELKPMFVSPTTLVAVATTGSDPLKPIEYFFEEEFGKWKSGWVKETNIRLDERNAARPLRIRVKMRDACGNETKSSEPLLPVRPGKLFASYDVLPTAPTVVEAEHFVANVPSPAGVCTWEKRNDANACGAEGYMSTPDRGMVNQPFSDTGARLDYVINFKKPGKYYLWIRGNGNNDGGQFVYAGLGLKLDPWGNNLRTGCGKWAWYRSPAFTVEQPFDCLFSLWMMQDGAMVDRFIITASETFEPAPENRNSDKTTSGVGPAESKANLPVAGATK